MKIAVWKTGHEIADTVAQALAEGFDAELRDLRNLAPYSTNPNQIYQYHEISAVLKEIYNQCDVNIAYGILRGADDVFKKSNHWFNIDRGYFAPGHYDGYYRISYRGTQAKYDPAFPITKEYQGELKPVRPYDKSKPVLICPPTEHVAKFFGLKLYSDRLIETDWELAHTQACFKKNIAVHVRCKGSGGPINWDDYSACITFNSSVGWQALINGIPCISDPLHSVVGSYYDTISIDSAYEMLKNKPRKPLLDLMCSHQFTLSEICQGLAWPLIRHYLQTKA